MGAVGFPLTVGLMEATAAQLKEAGYASACLNLSVGLLAGGVVAPDCRSGQAAVAARRVPGVPASGRVLVAQDFMLGGSAWRMASLHYNKCLLGPKLYSVQLASF